MKKLATRIELALKRLRIDSASTDQVIADRKSISDRFNELMESMHDDLGFSESVTQARVEFIVGLLNSTFGPTEANQEALRKKLKAANKKLEAFTQQANRNYRHEEDYLPYPEEDRRE
jgi:hypothetical protein